VSYVYYVEEAMNAVSSLLTDIKLDRPVDVKRIVLTPTKIGAFVDAMAVVRDGSSTGRIMARLCIDTDSAPVDQRKCDQGEYYHFTQGVWVDMQGNATIGFELNGSPVWP
jgi:hypothetical protein